MTHHAKFFRHSANRLLAEDGNLSARRSSVKSGGNRGSPS